MPTIDERMEQWLEEQADDAGYDVHDAARERYIEAMRRTLAYDRTRLSLALNDLAGAVRRDASEVLASLGQWTKRG